MKGYRGYSTYILLGLIMRFKKAFKLGIVVILIGTIITLLYLYQVKKEREYIDEANKFEKMLELTEEPGGNGTQPEEYAPNLGSGMRLMNRINVLDTISNEEDGILVLNTIADAFDYLYIIKEDTPNHDINKYYEANKEVIFKLFGIEDVNLFEEFANKISSIVNLRDYTILEDTIIEEGNVYKFDVEFNDTTPVKIRVKAFVRDRNSGECSIYIE